MLCILYGTVLVLYAVAGVHCHSSPAYRDKIPNGYGQSEG